MFFDLPLDYDIVLTLWIDLDESDLTLNRPPDRNLDFGEPPFFSLPDLVEF